MPHNRPWMVLPSLLVLAALGGGMLVAEEAPALINYQGVLRDSNDQPLDGFYTMVFRFWSSDAGGDEILVNAVPPVTVTNGLFNVPLGDGQIMDGAGPGIYGSLAEVFRDYEPVYLEVEIAGELLTPKVRILASAYALNAANAAAVGGKTADSLLDDTSATQTKSGTLELLVGSAPGYGVVASGGSGGGSFQDGDDGSLAYVASGTTGVVAIGDGMGGQFADSDGTGYANVGVGDIGIDAFGDEAAGQFENTSPWITASARIAVDGGEPGQPAGFGVIAYGDTAGGYFGAEGRAGWASPGFGDWGLVAAGGTQSDGGGILGEDTWTGTFGYLGYLFSSTAGNGTKNFVQNHPLDPDKVIVYSAPEGDEVGTYTRGQARLIDGVARVALGETFAWTTNPVIGLTADVTPRGDCAGLFVESVTSSEIVVRELNGGRSNAAFDYVVHGLRIGFEGINVVRPKRQEAHLPALAEDQLRQQHPELQRFNALHRFREMVRSTGRGEVDLSSAAALEASIGRYDRARHAAALASRTASAGIGRRSVDPAQGEESVGSASELAATGAPPPPAEVAPATARPADRRELVARSLHLSPSALASLLETSESVQPGDVVTIDTAHPGRVALSRMPEDAAVLGIVVAEPWVVLGSADPTAEGSRVPVAVSGIAVCRADAGFGAIRPGDLLTTSSTPGHAMRSSEPRPGTVLGKALDALDTGTGTVRVLVMPR